MFAARIFALVAFAVAVSAGCTDVQTGVCCNDKPVLTPRGYSATDCTAASKCAPKQYQMCCLGFSVADVGLVAQGHTASVCSQPTQGGQ
ncbi:hypothetical protein BV22DRAFT_1038128 [Leucogyrophana mollusca]|uniref:Uncharacterized protein n=1 Tax=Leucogyrophana mollusca TaxID=85980 RepID=A0ACB8B994_9AGAM|nr:hypothetical protein BV22DRAFT_1038128 [Leucogyrophana mollusca]